jgi:hypothetical protein
MVQREDEKDEQSECVEAKSEELKSIRASATRTRRMLPNVEVNK